MERNTFSKACRSKLIQTSEPAMPRLLREKLRTSDEPRGLDGGFFAGDGVADGLEFGEGAEALWLGARPGEDRA